MLLKMDSLNVNNVSELRGPTKIDNCPVLQFTFHTFLSQVRRNIHEHIHEHMIMNKNISEFNLQDVKSQYSNFRT